MKKSSKTRPDRPAPDSITRLRRSKKRILVEKILATASVLYFIFYWSNNVVETTRFVHVDAKFPTALDGFKFVHVSDLHGKSFGRDSRRLLRKIRVERPDAIVFTGDLIDERAPYPDFARETIERLSQIAPVFYVTGNHEQNFVDPLQAETLDAIAQGGATILDERAVYITRDADGSLSVAELDDKQEPSLDAFQLSGAPDPLAAGTKSRDAMRASLERLPRSDRFRVLLSHRPELIDLYASFGFDLVFCGHAHGGQFRVPFLLKNGLNAPHQGFFPKYTNGRYVVGDTTELVSRGLGPSVVPTRLFNRPHLIVCELRSNSNLPR